MSRRWLVVFALLLAAVPASADPEAEAVRDKVRAAVGYDAFRKMEHGVVIEGKAETKGAPGTFRLRFHADGRYAEVVDTPTGHANGFDGKLRWKRVYTNPALPNQLLNGDTNRFRYDLLGHRWLAPDGGYTVQLDPDEHRAYRPCLVVRHPDCPGLAARVYLDPATSLPSRFTLHIGRAVTQAEVADWRDAGGSKWPASVGYDRYQGGTALTASSLAAAGPAADPFAPPPPAADTRFAPDPAAVETKSTKQGFLLVRPRIGGAPGPWLVVNMGLSLTSLTTAAADRYRLPDAGRGSITGVGAVETRLRVVPELTLGPATVSGLVVSGLPGDALKAVAEALELPDLDGMLGGDVFARMVVEADFGAGTVAVHDPGRYAAPAGAAWEPATFDDNIPFVGGTFEGAHAGRFMLVTMSNEPVGFNAGAVRGRNLLAGRRVESFTTTGFGGNTLVDVGTGREFRAFGRTARDFRVNFATTPNLLDQYPRALGVITPALLGPGTVVLDYPNRRIGFVPRP